MKIFILSTALWFFALTQTDRSLAFVDARDSNSEVVSFRDLRRSYSPRPDNRPSSDSFFVAFSQTNDGFDYVTPNKTLFYHLVFFFSLTLSVLTLVRIVNTKVNYEPGRSPPENPSSTQKIARPAVVVLILCFVAYLFVGFVFLYGTTVSKKYTPPPDYTADEP